jgi:ribosomal protein L24
MITTVLVKQTTHGQLSPKNRKPILSKAAPIHPQSVDIARHSRPMW